MLIDGTGAPPRGPVDIVVEGNRITAVARRRDARAAAAREPRPPQADHEVDATGMYVMPGFVDMHVHAGGAPKNADAEYAYKLWLAHGVTTVRGVPLAGNAFTRQREGAQREERDRRAAHLQLPAAGIGLERRAASTRRRRRASGCAGRRPTASTASSSARSSPRSWRRCSTRRRSTGLGSTAHLQQSGVAQMNAIKAARARPRHRHALLRPLRIAAQGLRRPAVARRPERERRADALRPGRAPVGQDPRAGRPRVEGVPRRSTSSSAPRSIRR